MATIPRLTPLWSCLAAAFALAPAVASAINRTVTNCANTGAGSLRASIAAAGNGDTVVFDMGQMNCSAITLTSGQIEIGVDNLTLQGPGAGTLTVGGFHSSRVFYHHGTTPDSKVTINGLTIANGTVEGAVPYAILQGGCILSTGDVVLSGTTVSGCLARNNIADSGHALGGGISSYKLHMQNSILADNQAVGGAGFNIGGGAFVQDEIVVRSSTISGNTARGPGFPGFSSGGGLGMQAFSSGSGAMQIVSSTITNNESDFGGGLVAFDGQSARTLAIDQSTISSNKAHRYGGGVFTYHYGTNANIVAKIVNATISGNRSYGPVGGVYNQAYLTVSNSTIAFNRADTDIVNVTYHLAAGLATTVSSTLQSSIIAKNTLGASTGSDLNSPFGAAIAGSSNLVMVTLAGTNAPGGTLTADPLLQALANNGGPTLTHQLQAGSPALGAGNNLAQLASDQRGPGFARSTAGKTDIGAFQTGDGIFYNGLE